MKTKDDLHGLIDQLPRSELEVAGRYLEYLRDTRDPVLRAFWDAPEDDEPETEEDRTAVEEAKEEARRGEGRPWNEVREELASG